MNSAVLAKSDKGIELIYKVTNFMHDEGEHKVSRFDTTLKKTMMLLLNDHDEYNDHIKFVCIPNELKNRFTVAWGDKQEVVYLLNSKEDDIEYKLITELSKQQIKEIVQYSRDYYRDLSTDQSSNPQLTSTNSDEDIDISVDDSENYDDSEDCEDYDDIDDIYDIYDMYHDE
jgi:hypothetical protein